MTREELSVAFRDIASFSLKEWEYLHSFVQDWRPLKCLDLGIGHGVSTICIADAMRNIDVKTSILAVDELSFDVCSPDVDMLRQRVGLLDANISVCHEEYSYNWKFIEMLENEKNNLFDLIHIDGKRSWYMVGFAAMVAQRLLNPGGWLILSGADHAYATSWARSKDWVLRMPLEEQNARQVNQVFDLLVCRSHEFSDCRRLGNRFFARKTKALNNESQECEHAKKRALCDILDRAHRDPDFRFDLIWTPDKVIRNSADGKYSPLEGIQFIESVVPVPLGKEYDASKRVVLLNEPCWVNQFSRSDLQAMILSQSSGSQL